MKRAAIGSRPCGQAFGQGLAFPWPLKRRFCRSFVQISLTRLHVPLGMLWSAEITAEEGRVKQPLGCLLWVGGLQVCGAFGSIKADISKKSWGIARTYHFHSYSLKAQELFPFQQGKPCTNRAAGLAEERALASEKRSWRVAGWCSFKIF